MPAGRRTFTITEQRRTGAGTLVDTPVRFVWDAPTKTKPERGIETPLTVTTNRQQLAGTTAPVEQVLSAAWQPFTFEGRWDDMWAGAGYARRMRREFAALVARGGLVRVQWDDQDYVGIITEYVPGHLDDSKTRYKITLSPHTDAARVNRPIIPPTPRPTQGYVDQMDAITVTAEALQADARDLQLSNEDYADFGADIDDWRAQVDELRGTVGIFGLDESVAENLRRQAGKFRALRAAAQRLMIRAAVARAQTSRAFDDAVQELRFDLWTRELAAVAALMITRAHTAELDMGKRADSAPLRIYRPFAGQNVYSVALDVFGTTEAWRAIAKANNLSALSFQGNEILIIPEDASLSL